MKPLLFFILLSFSCEAQTFTFKMDTMKASTLHSYYTSIEKLNWRNNPDTIRVLLLVSDTVSAKIGYKFPNIVFKETFCIHGYIVHGVGSYFTPPIYLDDKKLRLGKNIFVWMAVPK